MLSLAGVELLLPTTALCDHIERALPVEDALPWVVPGAMAAPSIAPRPAIAPPTLAMPRELKLNTMYWPSGATRWSYGVFLASTQQMTQVEATANGSDGSGTNTIVLYMDDGQFLGPPVSLNLTLLRVVPLAVLAPLPGVLDAPNNLFLLVVVDQRYYWQATPCPFFNIPSYGSTQPNAANPMKPVIWRDCFTMLGTALGATISVDPIPNAYLQPDPGFNAPGMSAAAVLDAMCASVGFRLVANYDGSFLAHGWQAAQAMRQANDATNTNRPLLGGGDQFPSN